MLDQFRLYRASIMPRGKIKIWVSPQRILYPKTSREWPRHLKAWPFLGCPGAWDRYDTLHSPFREKDLREVLVEQADFRQSAIYAGMMRRLQTEGRTSFPDRVCKSVTDIDTYFERVLRLADNMISQGYQPAEVTGAKGDIDVRISRKGEILKCGQGTHRLAIARVLELPKVLVGIDLIHTRFLRKLGYPAPSDLESRLFGFFQTQSGD